MGADFNSHRTAALLKQRSLAEAKQLGTYKIKSSLNDPYIRERVRYINEKGISELRLKSRW